MLKRIAAIALLSLVGGILWLLGRNYPQPEIDLAFQTVVALTAVYVVGKVIIEEAGARHIQDQKLRYMFRKAVSIFSIALSALILASIWVSDPAALFVAYGLVGAGVAIALQDVFKNFVGGITLFFSSPYQVGDRVEIGGHHGDVIDIGLMYTRILEIQEWVKGDQSTGRIVTIPNGTILGGTATNYTADNTFIWDEITIPITYDSDWERARDLFRGIAEEETETSAEQAAEEIEQIRRKYYLSSRETGPQLFLELTDNWINMHLRFITDVRERRRVHNTISNAILEAAEDADDITIASQTIDIVGFPGTEDQ